MSVTFSCADVPTEEYRPYPDEDFVTTRPVAPFFEINLANGNAAAMLEAGGYAFGDGCGEWRKEELPAVLARIVLLQSAPATLTEPDQIEGNIYMQGRSTEYVAQRLGQFAKLCALAILLDKTIVWG